MTRRLLVILTVALMIAAASLNAFAGATITIVNVNAPGVGFNDPTPAAPVGGNPGTTIGQQRLYAFQYAANIWGSTLDSKAEIFIQASFVPLSCTATSATLGSAGTIQIISDFPGAEYPATWYHQALANKRAGQDLLPGPNNTSADDLRARFNSNLGNPGCLTGIFWYLGVDGNHGANIDLVAVLLHEFAHGLGFSQFASVTNGSQILGQTDIYGRHILDTTTGKTWDQMTDPERAASAINPRKVVWTGSHVLQAVPQVLSQGTPILKVNAPASIAGFYSVGTASFGPVLASPGITGNVVLATDDANASGPTTTDACTTITNPGAVAGNIALVDRGTCAFVVKVKNAQDAGAIAVLIADIVAGGPPAGLGGADPTITIPSVRITLADGNLLKANLAGLNVTLGVDLSLRAGANSSNQTMLYTPNPVQPGSTISHWDTSTFPNQLMEPAINSDLTHSLNVPEDMTLPQMRDVGWYPDADLDMVADDGNDLCLGSDLSSTVTVGGCSTGVPNTFFTNGCTISDLISKIGAQSKNHGDFVSGVAHLTNELRDMGLFNGAAKGSIQSCAAGAAIP